MKPNPVKTCVLGFFICIAAPTRAADAPRQAAPGSDRIGIYDPRAVGYAFFWTPEQQQQIAGRVKAAQAARAAGDTAQFRKLDKALAEEQKKIHRQVFSVAPVPEALNALSDRIGRIQKEEGVSVLISKWDQRALEQHPGAKQIDVTDLLVREFKPTADQLKTIAEIRKKTPVPLEQMQRLHPGN
jgi:CRISPR/Cas system-associated endoribonuclease Cas2